ncbi:ROK family protein [Lysinibacter cavernae]|uniref:Putative NBD/HSP70 family sugar kinase n=1 Tax=Lysinibacter cavernae TaxID=1640652 RepID=A0A7X5R1Q8_9MICO|nr:ROK family protein [Lysinibacter cavernae]NIH53837.1 putative NBD/HSP70 family sugar kinase [Lysinibacter cavernae]
MRVGIDIGGTKTAAVVVDRNGTVLHEVKQPTGYGAEEVISTVTQVTRQLADRAGCPVSDFRSIGIGIPGAVNTATGRVDHAVNLGLVEFELGAESARLLGSPVVVENDVNAAAVGAYRLVNGGVGGGAAGGDSGPASTGSLAYLNLGTGLAAGIVLDGSLWRGATGVAGEIGHIPVDPSGVICTCGQRGCLETISSGSGISRQWPTDSSSPVHDMMRAATEGDEVAVRIRDMLFDGVATGVRLLVLSVDVQSVVLGGGVTSLGQPLLDGVRGVLRTWSSSSPFLESLRLDERIRYIPDSFSAAAIGAALIGEKTHD